MANCWVGRHVSDPVSSIFSLKPHIGIGGSFCLFCKKVTQDMNDWHFKMHQDLQTKKLNLFESLYDCFWEGDFLWKKYLFQQ